MLNKANSTGINSVFSLPSTRSYSSLNHPFVLFAIFTSISITGTSVNTPTIVASAAGDLAPKREIATATANSKKFEAPIIPAGAAISCGSFSTLLAR